MSQKSFLDKVVAQLGYPAWVPEALTAILFGLAYSTQLYLTSSKYDMVSYGSQSVNLDTLGSEVMLWTPVVAFIAACVICGLRRSHKVLLVAAFALFVYGLTNGMQLSMFPAHSWAWGVVIALGCLLWPAVVKICWWLLAFVHMDGVVRSIRQALIRWGGRQVDRANARVSTTSS